MRISRAFSRILLVGCIVGATIPTVFAQDQPARQGRGGGQGPGGGGPGGPGGRGGMRMGGGMGGGGITSLLRMKEVRDELKIDEDQGKELDTFAQEMMTEMRNAMQANAGGGPPDMSKFREMQVKAEGKVEEILDPKQMDRLLGLLIQRDGTRSVNTAILATRLKITEEQKTKMAEVEKAAGEAMRGLFSGGTGGPPGPEVMEKMQTMRKENDEKLAAILTAEQKSEMESMKGEKFEFPAPNFGPGGPGGPGGGRGGRGGNRPGA